MSEKLTSLKIENKKAILQINRQHALNSLNKQTLQEIYEHCLFLNDNKNIQIVVICSVGDKAFVAGADIKEIYSLKTQTEAEEFSKFGSKVFSMIENLPQISIAKVQGFALGGGLELAMACDIIIASDKAYFGLPEVTLGLIPGFAGTQRLTRRIGYSKAIEWISTAERYTAEESLSIGLINKVTKHEELNSYTDHFCEKIMKNAPHAVRIAKKAISKSLKTNFEDGCNFESQQFGKLINTPESEEGIKAFIEKRSANF